MGHITRDASPEEKAAYAHAWYKQNKDIVKSRTAQWYRDNREHVLVGRRARYQQNKSELQRQARQQYWDNREQALSTQRVYRQETRQEVLAVYGGKCTCCDENNPEFLTLDHIDGGGALHRKSVKGSMWLWARHHDFPSLLQLLCYNCNGAKSQNKNICPHQLKQDDGQDQA